jgi:4-aminobutyrate aminotransferase
LQEIQGRYPAIVDVRAMGLMIGVELAKADGTPAGEACERLMDICREQGLLVINCGPERNIIRLIPPLTISDAELEQGLDILESALGAVL